MRRWIGAAVLLALVAVLVYVGRNLLHSGFRLGGTPGTLESRWRTEEEWLVDSIVRDLAEMARFAAERRVPPTGEVDVAVSPSVSPGAGPVKVTVTLGSGRRVEREVALASFVWSPEEYRDLARALLEVVGVALPPPATDSKVEPELTSLTDLRPAVIEGASQRISAELAKDFTDPALHEAAALVLGAFVLREAAPDWSDPRSGLCRMTAHLTFAAALRQGSSPSRDGRVAAAALLILAGRGADAAVALDALDRETDPGARMAAWRRALRLRLTDDPRIRLEDATLLERREKYRARLRSSDSNASLDYAQELIPEELTDRWRLAAEMGLSVENGNALLENALDLELQEAREVWALARGTALGEPELVSALNEPAARCVTPEGPRVIAWGTWAAALQRHLVACLWRRDHHFRGMLGLHQEADRQLGDTERRFSGLRLYPMIEARCSTDARRRPTRLDDVVTLAIQQPDLVNAWAWTAYAYLARYEVVRRGMPAPGGWFNPALPRGTTFDVRRRRLASMLPRDLDRVRALRAISPQDFDALEALVEEQFGDKGTTKTTVRTRDEVAPLFGVRLAYDQRALRRLAHIVARDRPGLAWVLRQQCALVADACHELGHTLVEIGDTTGAAEAYQRGLDEGSDQVLASSWGPWLMNHYLDIGRRARAQAVAEKVGATGSGGGLLTLARYHERTGDYDGAEALLKQVRERYGNQPQNPDEREESKDGGQDEDNLIAFYYRMAYQRKDLRYEKRFQELATDDFPNGVEHADLRFFSSPPTDGVSVLRTWPQGERLGFKAGDVVVALDGYRVRTARQFFLVRGFSDAPEMSVVVFRHPGYIELKPRSASRMLGFDLRSLKPSAATR